MKCTYCLTQTNTYQKYNRHISYVSPICTHHQNSRTIEKYIVPDHIPNDQHQMYLWQKHAIFTNKKELICLI